MLRPFFGILASLSVSATFAQTPPLLKSDPRFKQTVSLSIKYASVDEVFKNLSKQTGSTIQAASAISELKVTVFVKEMPCGQLLDKIANVLACTWKNDQGIEILTMSSEEKTKQWKYLAAEDKVIRSQAEQQAKAIGAAAAGTFEEFTQKLSGAPTQDDPAATTPNPPVSVGRAPTPETYAMGQVFHNWSNSDWENFWNGTVAYSATPPSYQGPAQPRNDENPDGTLPRRRPSRLRLQVPVPSGNGSLVLSRYDIFGGHQLEITTTSRGSSDQRYQIPALTKPVGDLAALPLAVDVFAWPTMDEAANNEEFAKQLPGQGRIPTSLTPDDTSIVINDGTYGAARGGSVFEKPIVTLSDQLEGFFKTTGIPVILDGSRISIPADQPPPQGKTPAEWLKSIQDADDCFIRIEDGVVMARHGGYWRLRQYEIPERLIRPMLAKAKHLTLSDYATFVSQLSPAQAASLAAANPPVLGFDTETIRTAVPALRFLGALNGAPALDQPVSLGDLDANAQQLFMNALFQGLFIGAIWKGNGPGPNPNRYGFVLSNANVELGGGVVAGTSLLFGSSKYDGIDYQVGLKN